MYHLLAKNIKVTLYNYEINLENITHLSHFLKYLYSMIRINTVIILSRHRKLWSAYLANQSLYIVNEVFVNSAILNAISGPYKAGIITSNKMNSIIFCFGMKATLFNLSVLPIWIYTPLDALDIYYGNLTLALM